MLKVQEKIVRNAIVDFNDTESFAISKVHDMMEVLEKNIDKMEIISPFTGQIFQKNIVVDTLDLIKTLCYYNNTGDKIDIVEG